MNYYVYEFLSLIVHILIFSLDLFQTFNHSIRLFLFDNCKRTDQLNQDLYLHSFFDGPDNLYNSIDTLLIEVCKANWYNCNVKYMVFIPFEEPCRYILIFIDSKLLTLIKFYFSYKYLVLKLF